MLGELASGGDPATGLRGIMKQGYQSVITPIVEPVLTGVNSLTDGLTGALAYTQVIVDVLSSAWVMANQFAETLVDRLKRTFTAIMILFGRIRSSMKRLVGVFAVIVNMMTSLIATVSSGINGPIGRTMSFFC